MFRTELSSLLGLPPDASGTDLLKARTDRLAELRDQLQQDGLPKPVKIMLGRELGQLESPAAGALVAQLEQISRAESLLVDIEAELAKPDWTRGVVELLSGRLKPLVPAIPDEQERLRFEKRLIELAEKLKVVAPPPPPPSPPPPPPLVPPPPSEVPKVAQWGSAPQHDLPSRIESYFAEIAAERTKPLPARGVVRLWMQKIGALIEQVTEEQAQLRYEKRLVEVEYWMDGSQPPWPKPEPAPVKPIIPATPPVAVIVAPPAPTPTMAPAKPVAGNLLQFLPKPIDGTLRRAGTPIHFVARPCFVLGRQRRSVDFKVGFLPDNPTNLQKNGMISRVNTTLVAKGAQLWIHDGEILADGKSKPSAGTVVDGQPVTGTPLQLNFAKERTLRLGDSAFELKAVHLPAVSPEGPASSASSNLDTASSQATVVRPVRLFGCMRFQPVSCREVEVNAVWLFSEASLGADASCAVVLEGAGVPPVALRVHHWEKGFWLTVPGHGKSTVMLDGELLAGGDVRALQAVHQLMLGSGQYELKVSP
jgi:hypothetical protein